MILKPNKITISIFGLFILFLASPLVKILLGSESKVLGFFAAISAAIFWFGPLVILDFMGIPALKACAEACESPEPTLPGIILMVTLNLLFLYFVSSIIAHPIRKKLNHESSEPRPLVT